jgi:Tfp pilus assembly protein PilV
MDPMGLENGGGLHPLAVVLGVVGILIMIILVSASSYQRERLQYMARKMLRKKRPSFSENQKQGRFYDEKRS